MNACVGDNQAMITESFKIRMLRTVWQLSGRRQRLDRFFSTFVNRKYLPECDAAQIIPEFNETEIHIRECPVGTWSTPLGDVYVLIKSALGFRSKRILELGSFRGDTARLLAENTGEDVIICAVDIDERHGASYAGKPIARKIVRKTGQISEALFAGDQKYDLIFVDANHDYASVVNDTQVAFSILSDQGVILWHDYAEDLYFNGLNGVPEALRHFSKTHSLYSILGTRLAIFSRHGGCETATLGSRLQRMEANSVWDEKQIRG